MTSNKMDNYKFPRTYADLDAAPWCDGYDPPKGKVSKEGDHLSISINLDWLPGGGDSSPGGDSLKAALIDLRRHYWHDMRPPNLQKLPTINGD